MQLRQLINRFRVEANDNVQPYFIEDDAVINWLNDAEAEACIRGRLLHESNNREVCNIAVKANQASYPLHDALYEISRIWFEPGNGQTGSYLALMSSETLNSRYFSENWIRMQGFPQFALQDDTGIRVVPIPTMSGELQMEGYRVPISPMLLDDDVPEIKPIHHVYLVYWALHKAFSVPDAEFFDPNRSAMAEQDFTDYFGERPDSDLRRITREDVPHHVEPFMP